MLICESCGVHVERGMWESHCIGHMTKGDTDPRVLQSGDNIQITVWCDEGAQPQSDDKAAIYVRGSLDKTNERGLSYQNAVSRAYVIQKERGDQLSIHVVRSTGWSPIYIKKLPYI